MEFHLTAEQTEIVRGAMKAGRVADLDEAVQQAMGQWIERERRRAELIKSIEEAEASVARGEGTIIRNEAEAEAFFDGIKQRGRARLEAEKSARA